MVADSTPLAPATLTVPEAARLLGIGRNSAYELVRTGQIPSLRLGRRLVVPRRALERLLECAQTAPAGEARRA